MKPGIIIMALATVIITGMAFDHPLHPSCQSDIQFSGGEEYQVQAKNRYRYVGAKGCVGRCHDSEESGYQYSKWKKSRHSNAYITLSSEKAAQYAKKAGIKGSPKESLTCLECHITAAGLDSTSFGSTYTKDEGVTCEACHKDEFITLTVWKGNSRVVNNKDLQPDEKTCLRCHNDQVHKTGKFNYQTMFMKMAHTRSVK